MDDFTISEATVPATVDSPGRDARDFCAMVAMENAIEAEALGIADLEWTPTEVLPEWQDPHRPHRLLLARSAGEVVGYGALGQPVEADATECWVRIGVDPRFRRRGIGSALWAGIRQWAEHGGRTTVQSFVTTSARDSNSGTSGPGATLEPGTGFGSVDADAASTRFALAHGFTLEQVERVSRLPLPVADSTLDSFASDARHHAEGYRVVTWLGATPPRWRKDLAALRAIIHREYPAGGLEIGEEKWDEARVIEQDDRQARSPRAVLAAAAEHIESGHLVGFTVLTVPAEGHRPIDQEDTLVAPGHRGHRLGMLLKVTNLARLQELYPGHPSVITYNAEENRPMLGVNEAVGFVPIGYEGGWKLTMSAGARAR